MRMAHHARCTRPGSAGVPPAPRLRGHGAGSLPDPPPPGAGIRLLPPAGGGWEGGSTRRTMVTAAIHAAPPHNAAMNIRFFVGGRSPPTPSHRVGGWGNRVSPSSCARAAPSRGPGPGCAGRRPASAMGYKGSPGKALLAHTLPPGGGMGKPGFPIPLRKGCARPCPPRRVIPGGIGNPAWSCSSPQLDSSTQGFGELSSCGGVELSQCDAIK